MAEKKGLELVHVELKRDTWAFPEQRVTTADEAVSVIQNLIGDLDREMLISINMATSGRVINASICSIGTMDSAFVSPPEIMRSAILSGASRIIMAHNHPSGDVSPSEVDRSATRRMATVSNLLGIQMLDSLIIGGNDQRFSFMESEPDCLEPTGICLSENLAAEAQPEYAAEAEKTEETRKVPQNYVTQNRKAVVDKMISLIQDGKSFYSPLWSSAAMRPQNPVSGAIYRGGNRFILMEEAMIREYKDPRWMTFKQLSSKGYRVKPGEHGVRLEKWIFTERKKVEGPDGKPIQDSNGHFLTEEVILKRPKCNLFYVFNGEQIQDFPKYEPKKILNGEIGNRIDAMIRSSECPIRELAQGESYYRPSTDEIFLPLRSAFHTQEGFASVAAHEMVHSTGHPARLAREFGRMDIFGSPDEKYCMEELKAELGSFFLMNDLGIPMPEKDVKGAAAYLESYINGLKENPNILFKIASEADKASQYLYDRFQKVYTLEPEIQLIGINPEIEKQLDYQPEEPEQIAGFSLLKM